MIRALILAAALSVVVGACGGGGSDPAGHHRPVTKVERPVFSADTLQISSVWFQNIPGRGDARVRTSCTGSRCTLRYGGQSQSFSVEDVLTDEDTGALSQASKLRTIGGVDVLQGRSQTSLGSGIRLSADTWGGWMEHGAFAAQRGTVLRGQLRGVDAFVSMSIGEGTTGSDILEQGTTWTGAMVGMRRDTGQGVTGAARLHYTTSLDIDFTGISGGVPDISWKGVGVCGGGGLECWSRGIQTVGNFKDSNGSNYIRGNFYGPNAEEVAGVFEHGLNHVGAIPVMGAFGAR